jgi:hypothetical protein
LRIAPGIAGETATTMRIRSNTNTITSIGMDITTVTMTAITIVIQPAMTATTGGVTVTIEEGTATKLGCL